MLLRASKVVLTLSDHGVDNLAAPSLYSRVCVFPLWRYINFLEVLQPAICAQNMGLGRLHCCCYPG
jgi:hypothetical protein